MATKRLPEFEQERLLCSALLSRFPSAIARQVRRLRREHLRHQVACEVREWVVERARRRGLLGTPENELLGARSSELPVVHERDILDELARDCAFMGWLGRRIDEIRSVAHLARTDPGQVSSYPEPVEVAAPVEGEIWRPQCDLGLGTCTVLDEAPDGFWFWVASQIAEEAKYRDERARDARLKVLHLDPRGGPLARALPTVALPVQITMQEVGPELSATRQRSANPHVIQNRCATIDLERYDFLVWSVASPSVGAASNQGGMYEHPGTIHLNDGVHSIQVPWLGKLGPTRWREIFGALIRGLIPAALAPRGTAIVRVPLGVRVQQRLQPRRNGYEAKPDLLHGLLSDLEEDGLEIVAAHDAEDAAPPPQPFVGRSRPATRVLVFRHVEVEQ